MIARNMKSRLTEGAPIRQVYEEGLRLKKQFGADSVFDFSIGNPNLKPPEAVRRAVLALTQSDEDLHGYMESAGYPDVRQMIAESLNRRFATSLNGRNVLMTAGAAGGINVILKALFDPGDELLVFAPFFCAYRGYAANVGANLVTVCPQTDFQPDIADFQNKLTPKTKAVLMNSPNNPAGVVYSEETICALASVLNEKQQEYGHAIYLISDEPYRELVYGTATVPYVTPYYENTIVVYSFSKTLSLAGERIGYAVIPDEVWDGKELMQAAGVATNMLGFVNAPSLFQKVVAACLEEKVDIGYYDRNRIALYENLKQLGFEMAKPEGAFYLFLKTPCEEQEFLSYARELNLLFVGGSVFGCPGYVRISFCVSYETILNSLKAFQKLSETLNLRKQAT